MINVITDTESLLTFEENWNNLFEKATGATPLQSFGYVSASIEFCKGRNHKIHIICIKDDPTNQWVAIFPLFLDDKGILTYINYQHTDFCHPIVNPDYNNYNLYKELGDYIKRKKEISGIRWDNVSQSSPLLSVLKPHFRYTIVQDVNYYSTIPIYSLSEDKDSIDAFRYVQAKQRRNLRKTISKIKADTEFQIMSALSGQNYPEGIVANLVNKMISDGIRSREYFSSKMLTFWRQLYDDGVLSLAIISQNGVTESCNFMFYDKVHNQYIKWIMLYMDNSWNMKINLMIANHLYNTGGGTINFARGIYDYKLVNFHPDVKPLFRVMIAKTRWGHFKNLISTVFHYSKPIIKLWLRR